MAKRKLYKCPYCGHGHKATGKGFNKCKKKYDDKERYAGSFDKKGKVTHYKR